MTHVSRRHFSATFLAALVAQAVPAGAAVRPVRVQNRTSTIAPAAAPTPVPSQGWTTVAGSGFTAANPLPPVETRLIRGGVPVDGTSEGYEPDAGYALRPACQVDCPPLTWVDGKRTVAVLADNGDPEHMHSFIVRCEGGAPITVMAADQATNADTTQWGGLFGVQSPTAAQMGRTDRLDGDLLYVIDARPYNGYDRRFYLLVTANSNGQLVRPEVFLDTRFGDDSKDGRTAATAFRTIEKLWASLTPTYDTRGVLLTSPVAYAGGVAKNPVFDGAVITVVDGSTVLLDYNAKGGSSAQSGKLNIIPNQRLITMREQTRGASVLSRSYQVAKDTGMGAVVFPPMLFNIDGFVREGGLLQWFAGANQGNLPIINPLTVPVVTAGMSRADRLACSTPIDQSGGALAYLDRFGNPFQAAYRVSETRWGSVFKIENGVTRISNYDPDNGWEVAVGVPPPQTGVSNFGHSALVNDYGKCVIAAGWDLRMNLSGPGPHGEYGDQWDQGYVHIYRDGIADLNVNIYSPGAEIFFFSYHAQPDLVIDTPVPVPHVGMTMIPILDDTLLDPGTGQPTRVTTEAVSLSIGGVLSPALRCTLLSDTYHGMQPGAAFVFGDNSQFAGLRQRVVAAPYDSALMYGRYRQFYIAATYVDPDTGVTRTLTPESGITWQRCTLTNGNGQGGYGFAGRISDSDLHMVTGDAANLVNAGGYSNTQLWVWDHYGGNTSADLTQASAIPYESANQNLYGDFPNVAHSNGSSDVYLRSSGDYATLTLHSVGKAITFDSSTSKCGGRTAHVVVPNLVLEVVVNGVTYRDTVAGVDGAMTCVGKNGFRSKDANLTPFDVPANTPVTVYQAVKPQVVILENFTSYDASGVPVRHDNVPSAVGTDSSNTATYTTTAGSNIFSGGPTSAKMKRGDKGRLRYSQHIDHYQFEPYAGVDLYCGLTRENFINDRVRYKGELVQPRLLGTGSGAAGWGTLWTSGRDVTFVPPYATLTVASVKTVAKTSQDASSSNNVQVLQVSFQEATGNIPGWSTGNGDLRWLNQTTGKLHRVYETTGSTVSFVASATGGSLDGSYDVPKVGDVLVPTAPMRHHDQIVIGTATDPALVLLRYVILDPSRPNKARIEDALPTDIAPSSPSTYKIYKGFEAILSRACVADPTDSTAGNGRTFGPNPGNFGGSVLGYAEIQCVSNPVYVEADGRHGAVAGTQLMNRLAISINFPTSVARFYGGAFDSHYADVSGSYSNQPGSKIWSPTPDRFTFANVSLFVADPNLRFSVLGQAQSLGKLPAIGGGITIAPVKSATAANGYTLSASDLAQMPYMQGHPHTGKPLYGQSPSGQDLVGPASGLKLMQAA